MAEISQKELNERVAILRRFRTLLEQQRGKFKEYLDLLEKQQKSISEENPESLIAHTELEQQVVKNIASLQKVIVPMSNMYKSVSANNNDKEAQSILQLQNELTDLQEKVLKQNEINRDLLRVHIESIRTQIQNFKNPYRNARSVYAQPQKVASLVEVEA
ncbi:MAG: flagellar export chaperone FlgN [Treponema sp.]|nr:flagellar export chaperone FlgN [Treponema sp.]